MIKRIKYLFAVVSMLAIPVIMPMQVSAANNITSNICSGANTASGIANGSADGTCKKISDTDAESPLNKAINLVIKYFSIIVGAASVIMIIYGGFKYVTSGGNDKNVSTAKNTIVYAVIGLVIVALAQVIVRFVLTNASV